MKNNDLDAANIAAAEFKIGCSRPWGKHWKGRPDWKEIRAVGTLAAQEILSAYAGRDRHKYPKAWKRAEAGEAARNAMRTATDVRKASSLILGSGPKNVVQDEEPLPALKGVGEAHEVEHDETAERDAVRVHGIVAGDNPGRRRMTEARAAREIAWDRLRPDQQERLDAADHVGGDDRYIQQQRLTGLAAAQLREQLANDRRDLQRHLKDARDDETAIELLRDVVQTDAPMIDNETRGRLRQMIRPDVLRDLDKGRLPKIEADFRAVGCDVPISNFRKKG